MLAKYESQLLFIYTFQAFKGKVGVVVGCLKALLLAVLLWRLHLVCSQQVVSPVDCLSDIHPGSQTQSSNMAVHMAKIPAVFEILTNHQPTTHWLCIGFTYRIYEE